MPALLEAVKDRNVGVKLAAERALVHALQVHGSSDVLSAYVQTADSTSGSYLKNYAKRVLSKLPEDSGDDSDSD